MTGWHLPETTITGYAAGRLDPVQTMSTEAHLSGCAQCRTALPVDPEWLEGSWDRLAATVLEPRAGPAEQALRWCRVPEHTARLLAGTPALSRAWFGALLLVLGSAVGFAYLGGIASPADPVRLLPFLLVTPVLPVAGVALAYGRRVDPAYELIAATPLAGGRLLLVRTLAVLSVAVAGAGLAAPVLPGAGAAAVAWLLPTLALTAACLALSTRVPVPVAAGLAGAGWAIGVLVATVSTGDRLVAFGGIPQIGYAMATVLCAGIVASRWRSLDRGGAGWTRPSAFAG